MRKFIERIKDAYTYDWAWAKEPLFFKAFLVALCIPTGVCKAIFAIVVGITFPLWIVPYAIVWSRRNKHE